MRVCVHTLCIVVSGNYSHHQLTHQPTNWRLLPTNCAYLHRTPLCASLASPPLCDGTVCPGVGRWACTHAGTQHDGEGVGYKYVVRSTPTHRAVCASAHTVTPLISRRKKTRHMMSLTCTRRSTRWNHRATCAQPASHEMRDQRMQTKRKNTLNLFV